MKELTTSELSEIYGGGWFYEMGKAVGKFVAEVSNSANEALWNEALNYQLGSGTMENRMRGGL